MKLKLSIRSQIVFLSSVLVMISFFALIPFMVKKFTDDKSAYLYDQVLEIAINSREKTEQIIDSLEKQAKIITVSSDPRTERLPGNILSFKIYTEKDRSFQEAHSTTNPLSIAKYSLDHSPKTDLTSFNQYDLPSIAQKGTFSEYASVDGVPLVSVFIYQQKSGRLFAFRFVSSEIDEAYSNNKRYKNILFTAKGKAIQNSASLAIDPSILSQIVSSKPESGVTTGTIQGESQLIGYSKHGHQDRLSLSIIPQKEAYLITQNLLKTVIGFAGIVLSIAIFFGAVIARNIIHPINQLIKGTDEISKKNYQHRIDIHEENEFRALAGSFNAMVAEITKYIEEVKDKTRMEKELEVAQLVQQSFFPHSNDIQSHGLNIIGHFDSASECGGDWWGCKEIGEQTIFYIGDATGHGVPAAFITATAHSCSALLPRMIQMNPALATSPSEMLKLFNDSIFEAGGKILMTLFIAIYDHRTHELTYANASHYPPILYRASDSAPSKGDLKPLMEAEGFRLGHKKDPTFTEAKILLNPGDVLYLFSDGLLESESEDGSAFGERRLIKSILSGAKESLASQKEKILDTFHSHIGTVQPTDDVGLVLVGRTPAK